MAQLPKPDNAFKFILRYPLSALRTHPRTTVLLLLVSFQQTVQFQGRGSHSGLCASNRIGAFPSRIPSRLNLAACRITDIVCPCRPSHPTSPGSRSIVVETAATSGSSGAHRGGRGRPSPNAVSGCKFPNRRIHKSVALSETCTRHEPPSYSIPTHRLKGGSYEG